MSKSIFLFTTFVAQMNTAIRDIHIAILQIHKNFQLANHGPQALISLWHKSVN